MTSAQAPRQSFHNQPSSWSHQRSEYVAPREIEMYNYPTQREAMLPLDGLQASTTPLAIRRTVPSTELSTLHNYEGNPQYSDALLPVQRVNYSPLVARNETTGGNNIRNALIGAGALLAASATIATTLFLGTSKSKSNEGNYDLAITETYTSQQEEVELDIYGTDIGFQESGRQLDVVMPFLEKQRKSSADTFNEGELFDTVSLTGDKKWAQETMNNFSYDVRTASLQPNKILAKNLLAGVFAPSANSLDSFSRQIESVPGPLSFRSMVDQVSESYSSGTIDLGSEQIPIKGETVLINIVDMDTSTAWNTYVTTQKSQNGKHETPRIVAMIEYGHREFVSDISDWAPEKE